MTSKLRTELLNVLVVDDDPTNLQVVGNLLQPFYSVRVANSGDRALKLAQQAPMPDLILLDIMMPDMDGYAVIAQLKANPLTEKIPVIFLTAMNASREEEKGLALGAVDYITKPMQASILLARVRTHLELKQARDALANQNVLLEVEVARRMQENELIQDVSIRALARLAEIRDNETGKHILRTSQYVVSLARLLLSHPNYLGQLNDRVIGMLGKSAPLHDIGKVGIPDQILRKPGKLTAQEWVIMKTHAELGAQALEMAEKDTEHRVEFLGVAKTIAHWHHENWDGSGYPDGLMGEKIPLAARIMKIADVFDALISRRVYKEAFDLAKVRSIMSEGRATLFDPELLDVFLLHFQEFVAIAQQHPDAPSLASHDGLLV